MEYARAQSRIKEIKAELREIGAELCELGDHLKSDTSTPPTVEGKTISFRNSKVQVTAVERLAHLITEFWPLLEQQRVLRRDLERTSEGSQLLKAFR